MSHSLKLAKVVSCISLLLFTISSQARQIDPDLLENYLDSIDSDGMVVLVAQNDKVVFSKAYGLADREKSVRNSTTTKFQIGSMTKQFTAMAIMMLEERGKIELTAPISTYLNDIPDLWKPLTTHQLLTHTSGLMHAWELPNLIEKAKTPKTLDQVIGYFKDQPLFAEPGTQWHYSGLAYFILAKIIEVQSGQTWEEFIQKEIFNKLDMKNSGAGQDNRYINGLAKGYLKPTGKIQNAPEFYMPLLRGGGDIYSTTEDLFKWDNALRARKLISDEGYDLLFSPVKNNYGYGWFIDQHQGTRRIHHSGSVPGYNANIARYPEKGLVVIAITNVTGRQGYGRTLRSFTNFVIQNLN